MSGYSKSIIIWRPVLCSLVVMLLLSSCATLCTNVSEKINNETQALNKGATSPDIKTNEYHTIPKKKNDGSILPPGFIISEIRDRSGAVAWIMGKDALKYDKNTKQLLHCHSHESNVCWNDRAVGYYKLAWLEAKRDPVNYQKMRSFLEKSVHEGFPMAYGRLVEMYIAGAGGKRDLFKAAKLAQAGVKKGDKNSAYYLSSLYRLGLGGLKKDPVQALFYLKKAIELHSPQAMQDLASHILLNPTASKEQLDKTTFYLENLVQKDNTLS